MVDDFGSAQTPDLAADLKRQGAGQAVEKAGGVEVACPGGVDDAGNRRRRDRMLGSGRQYHAARRAARQGGDRDMPAHRCRCRGEVVRLVKRADFGLVGEENVDMPVDQVAERRPMPPDAKRVG